MIRSYIRLQEQEARWLEQTLALDGHFSGRIKAGPRQRPRPPGAAIVLKARLCRRIFTSLRFLQQHFGEPATWYLAIANGADDRPVIANRQRKSSGSVITFAHDLTAAEDTEAGVADMVDEVWYWCEKTNAFGRTGTVKVKFADFQIITRGRNFPRAIAWCDAL